MGHGLFGGLTNIEVIISKWIVMCYNPLPKRPQVDQNGVEKWNNLVFMNIIVLDIYVLNCV
jgi:hypothetical protein